MVLPCAAANNFPVFSDASHQQIVSPGKNVPSEHKNDNRLNRYGVSVNLPKLYAGVIIPNKRGGQFIELEASDTQNLGLSRVVQMYPYKGGLAIGLSEVVSLGRSLDLAIEGFYLKPTFTEPESFYYFNGSPAGNNRVWNTTESQIGNAGAEIRWPWDRIWGMETWSVVLGVRFDYLSLTFKDPRPWSGPLQASAPTFSSSDSAYVGSRAFIPYIGIHYKQENSFLCGSFRGIVSPVAFGVIDYNENFLGLPNQSFKTTTNFERSYLCELYGDAIAKISENFGIGTFLRMGIINSYPQTTLETTFGNNPSSSAVYHMNYRMIQYLFGTEITCAF
jgi:hypothetical protein